MGHGAPSDRLVPSNARLDPGPQRCCRLIDDCRELAHYQGEKDPFKGDSLNQRVRDAAKETIEVIYAAAPQPAYSGSMASQVCDIRGVGGGTVTWLRHQSAVRGALEQGRTPT